MMGMGGGGGGIGGGWHRGWGRLKRQEGGPLSLPCNPSHCALPSPSNVINYHSANQTTKQGPHHQLEDQQ